MTPRHMGAEGYLVSPAVFKTVGDGVPVLVCSIRTRPRQLNYNKQEVVYGISKSTRPPVGRRQQR